MSYYSIFAELATQAVSIFNGYCKNINESECKSKILRDFSASFSNFQINTSTFLYYNLFSVGNKTNYEKGRPKYEGSVEFKMPELYMNTIPRGSRNDTAMSDLSGSYKYDAHKHPEKWLYSMNTGMFHLPIKNNRSGVFSLSYDHHTLGNMNYGYYMQGDGFVYMNDNPADIDDECHDTVNSKSDSLYNRKFNCIYGKLWINETIDSIEIFGIKNPGYEYDTVYFIEPEIPYSTSRPRDSPLYNFNGKFHNTAVLAYGIPMTIEEQSIKASSCIINNLVNFSLK